VRCSQRKVQRTFLKHYIQFCGHIESYEGKARNENVNLILKRVASEFHRTLLDYETVEEKESGCLVDSISLPLGYTFFTMLLSTPEKSISALNYEHDTYVPKTDCNIVCL